MRNIELAGFAYGIDSDSTYYVQSVCNTEHDGKKACGCATIGTGLTEDVAKQIATNLSELFGLTLYKW